MALRTRYRAAAALIAVAAALAGCGGGPPPPDWQLNASLSQRLFERRYLAGDPAADLEFRDARAMVARTGRTDLLARLELARCALRVASLDFDDCPAFEALRVDAGPEERAYADYLAGRAPRRAAPAADDFLAQLVDAGVHMRHARLAPDGLARAAEIASAQGWRRPLVAWLGVLKQRAEQAGDRDAAERLGRRIEAALR